MTKPDRMLDFLRSSPLPYLGVLAFSYMLGFHLNYMAGVTTPGALDLKSQSPAIYIPWLLVPLAAVLWLLYRGQRAKGWALVFLVGLGVAWVVHIAITMTHGDMYTHSVWLFLPTLAMIALKSPGREDAWTSVTLIAWIAAIFLLSTRILEIVNIVPMFNIPDVAATEWEKQNYFLPLSGYLGLDGRWPGPFGFNSKTGFISAFILIVAVQRWRLSSFFLGTVGLLGVVLTGGRAPYLAALAGLMVLVIFAPQIPLLKRVPPWIKVLVIAVSIGAVAAQFALFTTAGATGREGIWGAFLSLWRESPWIGVGQVGIWNSTGSARITMDAHSVFVQELTKYGVVGFITIYVPVLIGLGLALTAAARAWAGPMAVLAAYLISGFTDVLHDGWQTHSAYSILVILCVLSAAGQTKSARRTPEPPLSKVSAS